MKKLIRLFVAILLVGSVATVFSIPSSNVSALDSEETTEPTENPGEEWSGDIPDLPGENITEPATPTAPTTPTTPTAPSTPKPETPSPAPRQLKPAQTATAVTSTPEETPEETPSTEQPTKSTDTLVADEPTTDEPESVLVPETARPNTVQKIRILAIISTSIVFFTAAFTFLLIGIFKTARTTRTTKAPKVPKAKKLVKAKKLKKSPLKKSPEVIAKDANPLLLPPSH